MTSKRRINDRFLNPIGLGCMGMSEFYGPTDDIESMSVLEAAIELGVEHLDTADMYGYGKNEILLGRFLSKTHQRDKVFLATKCGILRDNTKKNLRSVDNSPEYIVHACDMSTQRLGTYIDLFYLHRIENDGTEIEKSMEGMAKLLDNGTIRAVGLSEASEKVIRTADTALRKFTSNRHGISAIQSEYSLLTRTVEYNSVLQACKELDIAFVAYSPLCRGMLSNDFRDTNHLAKDDFRRTLPRFSNGALENNVRLINNIRDIAEKHNATLSQISLAWLLARSPIVHPIPGTKKISYLEQNIKSANIKLDADDIYFMANFSNNSITGSRYSPDALAAFSMDP